MAAKQCLDTERFEQRFESSRAAGPLATELEALGSDYGATGYTTRAQADQLGAVLGLGPGKVLLDIGAGCGWPGLYLATTFGCSVISTDPIAEGATAARDRLVHDGLRSRALAVVASGEQPPIRSGSVDAVVHSDVTC